MSQGNIAKLDYQDSRTQVYLKYLHGLDQRDLIVPSLDRNLTDTGRQVVKDSFGDTLDIGRIVRIVAHARQRNPDLSEVDAFIYEASDIVEVMSSSTQKEDIDIRECQMLMPRKGTYVLAAIHILRKATEAGIIMMNPSDSPKDQCYIKYN